MADLNPVEKQWGEALRSGSAECCLPADALIELSERGRRAKNYRARVAHISTCASCRHTLKELQAVERMRPKEKPLQTWLSVLVPAGAMAAVLWLVLAVAGRGTLPQRAFALSQPPTGRIENAADKAAAVVQKHETAKVSVESQLSEGTKPKRRSVRKKRTRQPDADHVPSLPVEKGLVAAVLPSPSTVGSSSGEVSAVNIETGEVTSDNSLEGVVVAAPADRP